MEGVGLNSLSKGMAAVRRIGERANAVTGNKQSRCYVAPGIAESTCYHLQFIRGQTVSSAVLMLRPND